jgi:endonuclease YncB( thermonuclease family)
VTRALAALALSLLPLAASAQPVPPEKPALVRVERVIDADTIATDRGVIRIAGIDAAEKRAGCRYEREVAADSEALLRSLIAAAPDRVRIVPLHRERGKDSRLVAEVLVDGKSVERAMYASGLVRLWAGKRRTWCR